MSIMRVHWIGRGRVRSGARIFRGVLARILFAFKEKDFSLFWSSK